jgi:hypothetical protein
MMLGIGAGGDLALGPAQVPRVHPLAAVRRSLRIVRAVCDHQETEGYTPVPHAVRTRPLPVYIGARSERLNRLASSAADGSFIAGVPRSRLQALADWSRSVRPVDLAIYCDGVFSDEALDARRPRWVYNLLNGPEETRAKYGITLEACEEAAAAFSAGDDGPARALITDEVVDDLVIYGRPEQVGRELATRVRSFQPQSVGLTLLTPDPRTTLDSAAAALAVARKELD